jgi:hypothetical protein
MDKVLTIFIQTWVGLVALINVIAIAGLVAGAASFWAGIGRVQEMYSPLTISTYPDQCGPAVAGHRCLRLARKATGEDINQVDAAA